MYLGVDPYVYTQMQLDLMISSDLTQYKCVVLLCFIDVFYSVYDVRLSPSRPKLSSRGEYSPLDPV